MTTRKEINQFIEKLSVQGGHRERVREFCRTHPKWNPITGEFDDNIAEDA